MPGLPAYATSRRDVVQEKRLSPYYFFEHHAQQQPDAECIWWRGTGGDGAGAPTPTSYTRAEAYHRANQFAQFFLVRGVRPGDLVGLFMDNSPDFIFAWFGLLAVGAAPALLNHNLPPSALMHCLSLSGATLLLAAGRPELLARLDDARPDLAARGITVVLLDDGAEVNAMTGERPPDHLRADVAPRQPFGLFYTRYVRVSRGFGSESADSSSGTTGMPKACALPMTAAFGYCVSVRYMVSLEAVPFHSGLRS